MLAPTRVAAAAEALGGAIDEDSHRLDVAGVFDAAAVAEWNAIIADAASLGLTIDLFDAFTEPRASVEEGQGRVTVRKTSTTSTTYFFRADGFRRMLHADALASARRILVAGESETFETRSYIVEPWIALVADNETQRAPAPPSPVDFVRDKGAGVVPRSIADAILLSEPGTGASFTVWRDFALTRLRTALATEVYLKDSALVLGLDGPRTISIDVDNPEDASVFTMANEAARWVYDGPDVESKLILFTAELARDWPEHDRWSVGFPKVAPIALAAAKRAHRNALVERSNETLKSLGELRKNLGDEIARTVLATRELVAASWRDFAIAIAALVARLTVLSSATVSPIAGKALVVGVCVFLAATYLVKVVSTWRFNDNLANVRKTWRVLLYSYLSEEEYAENAGRPLRKATNVYVWTAIALGIAYAVVIALVLAFGLLDVGASSSNSQSVNSAAATPVGDPWKPASARRNQKAAGNAAAVGGK